MRKERNVSGVSRLKVAKQFHDNVSWDKRPSLTSNSPRTRHMKSRFLQ